MFQKCPFNIKQQNKKSPLLKNIGKIKMSRKLGIPEALQILIFGSQPRSPSLILMSPDKSQSLGTYVWNAHVHVLLVITQLNDCQGHTKKPHVSPVWCSDLWGHRSEVVWGEIWHQKGLPGGCVQPLLLQQVPWQHRPTEILLQAEFNIIYIWPEKEQLFLAVT